MSYIQPQDRSQFTMMGKLDDLVSPDHPVRLLDMMIDEIVKNNPDVFGTETFGDPGRPEFSHATLQKEIHYGYCNKVNASRRLETESERNIELIWLLGALSPDHWVIANYRANFDKEIKFVATKVRQFLRDNGYIAGKRMAVDGSKFKANARRDMLTIEKIEKRFEHAERDLEKYLQILADNDTREDVIESLEQSDDSWTDRESALLDRIVKLQQELESLNKMKETMKTTGQTYISPTDPEARLMRSRDGKVPAYNVQIIVDDKHKFIADSEVLTDENDLGALAPMVDSLIEELGITPEELLADAGYNAPDAIEQVESSHNIGCYVAQKRKKESPQAAVTFSYDQPNDQYVCSRGRLLPLKARNVRKNKSLVNVYQGTQCHGCPIRTACTQSKYGRQINRYVNHQWREQFKQRMKEYKSRIVLAIRKCLAEHPFGTIKWLAGKIPLLLRGQRKVSTEINLYTTAFNLKRLFNLETFETLTDQFATYNWKTAKA
jgi:transposase